jgi:hypothetical protein
VAHGSLGDDGFGRGERSRCALGWLRRRSRGHATARPPSMRSDRSVDRNRNQLSTPRDHTHRRQRRHLPDASTRGPGEPPSRDPAGGRCLDLVNWVPPLALLAVAAAPIGAAVAAPAVSAPRVHVLADRVDPGAGGDERRLTVVVEDGGDCVAAAHLEVGAPFAATAMGACAVALTGPAEVTPEVSLTGARLRLPPRMTAAAREPLAPAPGAPTRGATWLVTPTGAVPVGHVATAAALWVSLDGEPLERRRPERPRRRGPRPRPALAAARRGRDRPAGAGLHADDRAGDPGPRRRRDPHHARGRSRTTGRRHDDGWCGPRRSPLRRRRRDRHQQRHSVRG